MSEFASEGPHLVNATTAGDQLDAQVALLPGGGHVVAWTTAGTSPGVFAQFFDANGARSGGEVALLQGYALDDLAVLADGSLVATATQTINDYASGGPHSGAYVARFDAAGHELMAPTLLATGDYDLRVAGGAVFAMPGGGYAAGVASMSRPTPLSWYTDSVQVFDAANAPTAGPFTADGTWAPQRDLARMNSGAFVLTDFPQTGPGPSRMDWRVVDAHGNAIASASYASVYGQVNYGMATPVALADGRALVAWSVGTYNGGGYDGSWQAQWIDASGHASGGVFTWDFSGGGGVMRMTGLANGGFLASWMQSNDGGAHYQVYGQAFDAAAHAASAAMQLVTLPYSNSPYDIVATADGGFLVDYQSAADGQDIYEQKFDPVPGSSAGGTPGDPASISVAGAHTQYTVSSGTMTGPDGTIPLAGIERVHFGDGYAMAFDIDGNAGEAYRIYQAAFDRAPDLPGLGYHINDLDHGVPLWLVAQHFIDSPEFQATYGSTTDTQFISLLYQNVLHRAPDDGGLQFHLGEFAQGESRADMLCHFSESPENEANVIGQIGNGMLYVPLA